MKPSRATSGRERAMSHGVLDVRRHRRPTRSASTPYAPVSAYDDEEPRLAPPAKPSSPEPSLRVTTQSWNTSTPRGTVSDRQRRGRMRTDTSRHVFRMVGADSPASSMHAPEPEASVPFKALGSAAPPVPSPPAAVDANEADDMDERLQQELDALWMNEENERHKAYARLATPDRRSHRSVGARSARRRRTRRAMARSTSMGALAARPEPEASEQPGGGTSDSEEDFQDAATARTLRTDAQAQLRAELLSQQREIEERKRRLLQEQREAMRLAELEQQRLAELERKAAELEHQRLAERQQQERIAREAERQQRELERLEQARRLAVEQERMREAERLESERVRLEQRMREAAEREAAAKRAQQQALAAEAEREKRRLDGQLAAEARRVQKEKERAEAARAAAAERERARREAEEKAEQARRAAIAREEQARQAALEQAEREQARLAALEQAARERERLAALEAERERRAAEEREKQEQARLAALEQAARERERLAALEAERERRAAEERAEQEKARLAALEQEARERERLAALEAERERRAADERAEQARLASLARAEREQRIADEQAEHARRKEAAVAAQRAREAEAQAAEQRARAAAEAERAREEREAHAEETQHTAVQQEAEREALCRAYAAREAREAERLQLEGRALRRAWREADDEDRMIRTQARRTEDSDDAASATETEHSGTSDATDASRLTHMLGRLRIVSRQGAPGTTGILTSAPSAPQQRLRFTVPAPARDESVRAHPALPWLSHIMEVHVPRTVAPPSASASNLAAVDVAVHAVGAVAHRLRASMLSMHSLDSAMPDEAWAVRPVGAYRNGGVRYLPGFTVHGLAEAPRPPQAVRGELLLTAMPLAFVQQLLMHLDFGDIRALYDVSASVRKVLQQPEVHETVLRRFLGPFGYVSGASGDTGAVALPLSLLDVEGFLMYVYGGDELYPAAHIYLTSAHQLDRRLPRLARAMVRSYNRVLAHVRLQAPSASSGAWEVQGPDGVHAVQVSSLVTPGLVSMFQAWAPAWPSGAPWVASQVQRVERELFVSGVWRLLRKGDMALNMATDERFVFDGYALVPLATEFDAQGHLPACINALRYAPTYFDPVLPPTATPAMYMNVSPWRDEIVTSLQLVRDNIERTGANRQLYRISKWVYRAAFTVSVPAEDTPDFIASAFEAHAGWNGTVVIDVESTAEHVARFLERCRCPGDPASWVTDVLAHVLESTNSMLDVPRPTSEEHGAQTLHPFYLLRERSGAGVAWLVPA
ncbi:hypothetical protein MCAP1_001432 [Malassezia caprae]|uniref:F-box domain-containing protein n=1 Tax=Malassezia caprae TaxID=1381934 RepID=A0AAF0IUW7_9BASI|nr:hypothetical protein MCAP1_001432 [Malassezia caprae]